MTPLVTVVTPTWQRPELLRRAVRSVEAQTYPRVEHLVVSDGPDASLADLAEVRVVELGRNWHGISGGWGAEARMAGTLLARGDFIAYLDDDNVFLPDHLALLVERLEQTGVDLAFAQLHRNDGIVVGDGSVAVGRIDTSMVVHRAETLRFGHWRPQGYASDGHLFTAWAEAGATHAFVPRVTVLYGYPHPLG